MSYQHVHTLTQTCDRCGLAVVGDPVEIDTDTWVRLEIIPHGMNLSSDFGRFIPEESKHRRPSDKDPLESKDMAGVGSGRVDLCEKCKNDFLTFLDSMKGKKSQ